MNLTKKMVDKFGDKPKKKKSRVFKFYEYSAMAVLECFSACQFLQLATIIGEMNG